MHVATGLAQSPKASASLAAKAVASAMQKAEITSANGVLLFLTIELLPYLTEAIRAAAKVAQTTQVFGCTAIGIFTEEDWVLDCPAAAAIVFGGTLQLGLASQNTENTPSLTLCTTPDTLKTACISYGGISGDANGQGHHVVWQSAHSQLTDVAQTYFKGAAISTGLLHGLTLLSTPRNLHASHQFDITQTHHISAYNDLHQVWTEYAGTSAALPSDQLVVMYADNEAALMSGEFSQADVIHLNPIEGSVTLSKPIPKGKTICWALYNHQAKPEVEDLIKGLCSELTTNEPSFGLCFSTLHRGPFEDGIDHDLNAIKQLLPTTPLIGFYGNGTIAHIDDRNQVLNHTIVLNLFNIKN